MEVSEQLTVKVDWPIKTVSHIIHVESKPPVASWIASAPDVPWSGVSWLLKPTKKSFLLFHNLKKATNPSDFYKFPPKLN